MITAWALIAGLVEGGLRLTLQSLALGVGSQTNISPDILWVAPLSTLLGFGILGIPLIVVWRRTPARAVALTTFVFAFLTWRIWLPIALSYRIHAVASLLLALGIAVQLARWSGRHEATVLRWARKSVPLLVALLGLLVVVVVGGPCVWERLLISRLPAAPPGSPNVLVVVVDTLRADHLSAYGYPRPTSPYLERLAGEGVLFENAFSASPYTLPSHASLLSGRYVHEHGVEWATWPVLLRSRWPTLPEVLLARGYRTAAFSANVHMFTRAYGFGRGFLRFEDHPVGHLFTRTAIGAAFERHVLRRAGFEDIPFRQRAADINRRLLRWIDAHEHGPYFAVLNYMDTHDPYLPPEPFQGRFSTKSRGGIVNHWVGRNSPTLTPAQVQGEIDAFDGGIAYVDQAISQLLAWISTDRNSPKILADCRQCLTSSSGAARPSTREP